MDYVQFDDSNPSKIKDLTLLLHIQNQRPDPVVKPASTMF